MSCEFKKGDSVRLKSGGPIMTVSDVGQKAITEEEAVWCIWFEGSKRFEDTFPPETLMIAPPPKPRVIGVTNTKRR